MKTTINKEFFNKCKDKRVVMNCKTERDAEEFCKILDEYSYEWADEGSYLDENCWNVYRENTCYNFNDGTFGSIDNYTSLIKTEVLNFEDYKE